MRHKPRGENHPRPTQPTWNAPRDVPNPLRHNCGRGMGESSAGGATTGIQAGSRSAPSRCIEDPRLRSSYTDGAPEVGPGLGECVATPAAVRARWKNTQKRREQKGFRISKLESIQRRAWDIYTPEGHVMIQRTRKLAEGRVSLEGTRQRSGICGIPRITRSPPTSPLSAICKLLGADAQRNTSLGSY